MSTRNRDLSDSHDEITKVLPQDLDSSDSEVATEYSDQATEPTRIESEKALLASTTENQVQSPRMLDTGRKKSSDISLDSREFRVDMEPEVRTHAGTSPGVLLPDYDLKTEEKETLKPQVRPVSLARAGDDRTSSNGSDDDFDVSRAEPTRTLAHDGESRQDEGKRRRGRVDSLIDRIGVPAGSVEGTDIQDPAESQNYIEVSSPLNPRVATTRKTKNPNSSGGGDQKLWLIAAVFGLVAIVLTIIATIMFTQSD
ncbi:MAG: hypothetical protein VYC39_19840 [Myxococcota bacterium]|nr:hypothetical protein [Myxococcota bacterium]